MGDPRKLIHPKKRHISEGVPFIHFDLQGPFSGDGGPSCAVDGSGITGVDRKYQKMQPTDTFSMRCRRAFP